MSKTNKPQPPSRRGLLHADQRTCPAIRDKLGEQFPAVYEKPEEERLSDCFLHLVTQFGQPHSRGKP